MSRAPRVVNALVAAIACAATPLAAADVLHGYRIHGRIFKSCMKIKLKGLTLISSSLIPVVGLARCHTSSMPFMPGTLTGEANS